MADDKPEITGKSVIEWLKSENIGCALEMRYFKIDDNGKEIAGEVPVEILEKLQPGSDNDEKVKTAKTWRYKAAKIAATFGVD